jgi:CRISPR-associated protein Cas1
MVLEDVFSDENLEEAFESFADKHDSHGLDGVKLSELRAYWETNGKKIKESIFNGTYKVGAVEQRQIVNRKGKKRTISLMNSIDRFIFRALYQKMASEWEKQFSQYSYAYQNNKGVLTAVEQAAKYMEEGKDWSVELDIQNFFDNINHSIIISKLKAGIEDVRVLDLLIAYLTCTLLDDHVFHQMEQGVLQGGPLSPLLANVYMNELDHYMEKQGYSFCRFGDDINIYCSTYEEATVAFSDVTARMEKIEQLPLNHGKTGIFKGINRKYLGYRFEMKDGHVIVKKEQRAYKTVYRDWYTTGIQKMDHNYHLINEGILTKQDFNILFESENGKKYIPVETTDSLYIYSNVIMSGNFFDFMNQVGLNVSFINKYGEKIGSFVPNNSRRNIKTELKQLRMYDSEKERLDMARRLEIASVSNIRANLRYYQRRKNATELEAAVKDMTDIITKLNEARDINHMMMLEAQARQKYYGCFNSILEGKQFYFDKRTRRPPQDPLNAMISFGNTLLYQRIANEINRTSLDIRIGIVHAAGNRSESLNLDLADLFKPILVDRTIFTLVNRKMINVNDFVEVENNGIYLNNRAKKIFISEYENKLYQKVTFDGAERTYDYLIKNEIQKLKKYIENGEKYKPYKYV